MARQVFEITAGGEYPEHNMFGSEHIVSIAPGGAATLGDGSGDYGIWTSEVRAVVGRRGSQRWGGRRAQEEGRLNDALRPSLSGQSRAPSVTYSAPVPSCVRNGGSSGR